MLQHHVGHVFVNKKNPRYIVTNNILDYWHHVYMQEHLHKFQNMARLNPKIKTPRRLLHDANFSMVPHLIFNTYNAYQI